MTHGQIKEKKGLSCVTHRYLSLSGEGHGLRGGGVRGTAGLGAMVAAGIKP